MPSKLIKYLGYALIAVSIGFVSYLFYQEWERLSEFSFHRENLILLIAAAGIYAVSNLFLSSSWIISLSLLKSVEIEPKSLHHIYAKSALGKYIPGNVAHIAGRHVLARNIGIGDSALVFSTFYEMLGLALVASIICLFGALFVEWEEALPIDARLLGLLVAAMAMFFFLGHRLLKSLLIAVRKIDYDFNTDGFTISRLIIIFTYYLIFFAVGGLVLHLVVASLHALTTGDYFLMLVCFAASWLLGFVTPGAPSGLGVREAIVVLFLQTLIPSSTALIAAILFRLVTISGDCLFPLALHFAPRGDTP